MHLGAKMKKSSLLFLVVLSTLLLANCAPGPNPVASNGGTAGFLLGVWHGVIAPITFVISVFSENVNFYEVHNNGGWYDFGFVIGAGILFRSSSSSRK